MALLLLAGCTATPSAYPRPADVPHTYGSPCAALYDRHFVYDFAQLLAVEDALRFEDAACQTYHQTGAHLVLATVTGLRGEPIELYSVHLLRAWGIGDSHRLDGLLVLYTPENGGQVRIEVGYGLQGVVTGLVARDVVDTMSDTKRQDLQDGLDEAQALSHALSLVASALADGVRAEYPGVSPQPAASSDGHWYASAWLWAAVAVLVALAVLGGRTRGLGWLLGALLGGRRGGGRGGPGHFGGGKSGGGGWSGKP